MGMKAIEINWSVTTDQGKHAVSVRRKGGLFSDEIAIILDDTQLFSSPVGGFSSPKSSFSFDIDGQKFSVAWVWSNLTGDPKSIVLRRGNEVIERYGSDAASHVVAERAGGYNYGVLISGVIALVLIGAAVFLVLNWQTVFQKVVPLSQSSSAKAPMSPHLDCSSTAPRCGSRSEMMAATATSSWRRLSPKSPRAGRRPRRGSSGQERQLGCPWVFDEVKLLGSEVKYAVDAHAFGK